jgi:hypothetical protein
MPWTGNLEPTIDELLGDPGVRLLMARDGVDAGELRVLLRRVRAFIPANDREARCAESQAGPVGRTGTQKARS